MAKRYIHISKLMLVLAGLMVSFSALAQQGNPFELRHRQQASPPDSSAANPFELDRPDTLPAAAVPPADTAQANPFELQPKAEVPTAADNPFDIKKTRVAPAEEAPASPTAASKTLAGLSKSFLFWIILTMLIILTLSVSLYKSFIVRSYRAFTNENFLKLIHRDQGSIVKIPYLVLYVGFFINTTIFVYLISRHFSLITSDSFNTLFQLFGLVCGLFIFKHLILKIIGYTFPVNKEVKQYSFTIVIFSIIIGLLLAPLNTLIAFAPERMTRFLVFGALFVVGLIYLFRAFRGLFLASRFITFQKFHFFMYLCTVEIAPLLVLVKVITLKTGVQ